MWPFSSKTDPETWNQMRSEMNSQVLEKLEAIERATVARQEQAHDEVLRRIQSVEQTINNRQNYIRQEILNKIQAQDAQISSEVAALHTHVQTVLTSLAHPSLNGQHPIHDRINVYVLDAVRAIEALGREHALWLVEQQHSIEAVQGQLRIAATHIFPEEREVKQEG